MRINPDSNLRTYAAEVGARKFEVPSVTTVLRVVGRDYLNSWKNRVGEKEADRTMRDAQSFGTRLHAAAHDVALGKKIVVMDDLRPHVEAVEKFFALHVDEVVVAEKSLASARLGFGGTLDLLCRTTDGQMAVVDFKTTRQLTKTVGHQLAAYAMLAREHDYVIHRRIGVRVKKEKPGEFHARSYTDHRGDVRVFRACLELWWAMDAQKKSPLPEWVPGEVA